MPWGYKGHAESITPSLTVDNWALDAVDAGIGEIHEVHWGGEVVSSTAMMTRVARSDSQVGGQTNVAVAKVDGADAPANQIDFVTAYATTQPTLETGSLLAIGWNAHGGMFRWVADHREEWFLATGETLDIISCRNAVGTGSSTYGVGWTERSQN